MTDRGFTYGFMLTVRNTGVLGTMFGHEKSLSVGTHPATSLKQARQSAQAEREKLASNIDPSIDRKVIKQRAKQAAENSFEAVSREWYAKQIHTWVHSHAKDVKRRLELSGQFSTGVNKCSCPNDSTHLSCTKC